MSSLPVTQRKKRNQTLPMFLKAPDQEIPTTFQKVVYQIIILGLAFAGRTIAKEEAVEMPQQDPGVQGMDFMSQHLWRTGTTTQIQGGPAGQWDAGIWSGNWTTRVGQAGMWELSEGSRPKALLSSQNWKLPCEGPWKLLRKQKNPPDPDGNL